MKRWFNEQAAKLMLAEVNQEQRTQAKKIYHDEALKTQAAWCMIEQEDSSDLDSIHLLVATVLEDEKLTKEAVWFLVYKQIHTLDESHKLLKSLHYSKEKKSTKNKEKKMEKATTEKKPLSDKQVELALLRKEDALLHAEKYKDYLDKQDHDFFLNRPPFFVTHTRSFNKVLKEQWKESQKQKPFEIQQSAPAIEANQEQQAVHESAGMKL